MTHADSHADWDDVPCGLLSLRPDGTVLRASSTMLRWVGRDDLAGVRVTDLLSVGGRIYWETHLEPLLHIDGRFDEVALELRTPAGRMPVLMAAVLVRAPLGAEPPAEDAVRVAVTSARDRSRYERELLAARTAADRSAARLQALQEATAGLSRALGVDGVAAALLDATVGPLASPGGALWLTDAQSGDLVLAHTRGAGAPDGPIAGTALQERSAVPEPGRVVVPLHGQSSLQGALCLSPGTEAQPLDLEVLSAMGQQAGLALDRALLYEQSADVARTLQHALLDVSAPADPRFDMAAVYRPGVEMLEVGGDWYDVFLAAPGVLAVVVGDVVGRGLPAATAMGQLRSAVRAVAGADAGPARLLSRLDVFVAQVEAAAMATLAYAELDLATGVLTYACAGHPPPLLLPAAGPSAFLWEGRSTPLGAFTQASDRDQATVQLSPGDQVLLYTDGLVERRDRGIDEGLELLAVAATRTGDLSAGVRATTTAMLADEQTRDDVCVLLLSWSAGR